MTTEISSSQLSIENLKNDSPFFISDICVKYNIKPSNLLHFMSRNNRYLHFKGEDVHDGSTGRPVKRYSYVDCVICPHCGEKIEIDKLDELR